MARKKKSEEQTETSVAPTTDAVPTEPTEPIESTEPPTGVGPAEQSAAEASAETASTDEPKPDTRQTRRKCRRELDFLFTDSEYAQKAKRIAELELQRDSAQYRLDGAKAMFKEEEAEIDEELQQIVQAVRAGKEKRTVKVIEIMDYATAKVLWLDVHDGSELGQRDMRHDERQMSLLPVEPPADEDVDGIDDDEGEDPEVVVGDDNGEIGSGEQGELALEQSTPSDDDATEQPSEEQPQA